MLAIWSNLVNTPTTTGLHGESSPLTLRYISVVISLMSHMHKHEHSAGFQDHWQLHIKSAPQNVDF